MGLLGGDGDERDDEAPQSAATAAAPLNLNTAQAPKEKPIDIKAEVVSTAPASAERALSSAGVPLATTLPRSMMITRLQAASTSSRMCVEKMIALLSPMRLIKPRTSCF